MCKRHLYSDCLSVNTSSITYGLCDFATLLNTDTSVSSSIVGKIIVPFNMLLWALINVSEVFRRAGSTKQSTIFVIYS